MSGPDTPRPERTLPKEGGLWLEDAADGRLMAREIVADGDSLIVWDDDGEVEWPGWNWIAPIPTPEQLAAMHAKLAAGQALADAERALNEAMDAPWNDDWRQRHTDAMNAYQDAAEAFLRAFPPAEKGGAG